jgi:hypothetical protein
MSERTMSERSERTIKPLMPGHPYHALPTEVPA